MTWRVLIGLTAFVMLAGCAARPIEYWVCVPVHAKIGDVVRLPYGERYRVLRLLPEAWHHKFDCRNPALPVKAQVEPLGEWLP